MKRVEVLRALRWFVAWIAIAAFGSLVGCNEDPADCPQATPALGRPPLSGIPVTLEICSGRFRLDAELWRDFMPYSPEDGRPLAAVVTLIDIDGRPVDPSLSLNHLWVVTPVGYWSTRFNDREYPPPSADRIVRAASCGPKWEPGTAAEVVVEYGCGAGPGPRSSAA